MASCRCCSPTCSTTPAFPPTTSSIYIFLYFRRWAVEVHYRDEKTALGVETFHSKTENRVRQELFAILIMAVITRTLSVLPGG
ncbi:MAG: transposase [Methylococcales bacterium]